jgi:hypothetical protein
MAQPVKSDYDNPGQFAQALREYEAANPTTPVAPTELPEYKDLAYQAAGYSGDTETADYIRALASGSLGGEADTKNALNILIQQGQARNLAERGNVEFYPGYDPGGRPEDSPVSNTPAVPVVDPVPGGTRADAKNTIQAVLSTYGLGDLSDFLYGVYARGEVNINNPDALIFALREQDAYKKRFAANELRAKRPLKEGGPLAELDPASYLQLENSYRQLMQSNGLPPGFYDQTSDFVALLTGDVSPQELQTRVQQGFRAVQDADPEVKRQMQELYGVNEAGLAAYFLDPKKAAPILTRQAEAAKISARAKEQGGLQLEKGTAEELAARGITAAKAETAFTTLGLQQGLYTEMAGEQALTQQEKVGAALGYDVEGQRKIKQRQATRKSPFQGGGSFAKTTGQTSGTTETGLGVAE